MKKLLLFFTCTVFLTVGALAQATHYVSTTGNDDNTGESWDAAWASIQYAIDQAAPGDIIRVNVGVYIEFLEIDKSITIEGEIEGESRAVIQAALPDAKPMRREVVRIVMPEPPEPTKSDNGFSVNLIGLEIDGNETSTVLGGIYAENVVLNVENVHVHSIHLDLFSSFKDLSYSSFSDMLFGIAITGGELHVTYSRIYNILSNPGIQKNKVESYGVAGILAFFLKDLELHNNEIYELSAAGGPAYGISVSGDALMPEKTEYPVFEMTGNTIHDIYAASEAMGFFIINAFDFVLQNNEIEDIGSLSDYACGIWIESGSIGLKTEEWSPNADISGNSLSRIFNEVSDGSPSLGILYFYPANILIADNTITRAEPSTSPVKGLVAGPDFGIAGIGMDVQILDNELEGLTYGIYSLSAWVNLRVEDNTIGGSEYGVLAFEFGASTKSERFDIPFEMPAPPEKNFSKTGNGKLAFIGNTITGIDKESSDIGIWATLGVGPIFGKEEVPEAEPEPRFIARGNLVENFKDGISLMISGDQLVEINGQNIIQNNEYGVYVYHGADRRKTALSPLVFINHNTIQGNNFGVINGNYVYNDDGNNGGNGGVLKGEVMAPFIDAKFNYWGTEDGPGFVGISARKVEAPGNAVSEGVWYSPWLGFHPGTPPGDMTYYVDDSGSIQDAIDMASPGDIIRILSGDYEGDIVVGQGDGLTLYPGDSPACVGILGDLTVASGNTLFIEMDGTTPACGEGIPAKNGSGEYTQVYVFGEVDLGGITLDLNLGFAPEVGNQFEIIVSDYPITGMFSQGESITVEYEGVFYTFDILYNPNGNATKENGYMVVLELQQMDEPVAVPLSDWAIALGMLLMAGFVAFRFRM